MYFHPLDQKVWKDLGLDCCRVSELKVSGTEFDVPLRDSLVASGLLRMSESGALLTTVMGCSSK